MINKLLFVFHCILDTSCHIALYMLLSSIYGLCIQSVSLLPTWAWKTSTVSTKVKSVLQDRCHLNAPV